MIHVIAMKIMKEIKNKMELKSFSLKKKKETENLYRFSPFVFFMLYKCI